MKRSELNLTERRTIEDLLHRKVNVTEIARRINRHRATVYREIKPGIGTEAWFCDPLAPLQKASVENLNKRARRYLPRDTPISTLSDHDMTAICERLNGTPRKCL